LSETSATAARLRSLVICAAVALLPLLPACRRATSEPIPATAPDAAPPPPVLSTPWCGEGWRAVDEHTCIGLPERFAQPASVVVHVHGVLAHDALPTAEQATLLAAAYTHGFAVLFVRGTPGLCTRDAKVETSLCWPTKQDVVDARAPAIVAGWQDAQSRAEDMAGVRFERRYLFGFSNGGYFVAFLSVEGRWPIDGAGVVGAGRTAVDETLSGPAHPPFYLAVGDQEAPATRQDAATLAHVLTLRSWPLTYVVHPGRFHELHEDDLTNAWAAWGR
jgi:predicted esterase